jgi:response regulator RpfG family c-di-GMP phosphodiesterase
MNYLRRRGCDEMQGFHFSRALPADEFMQLLAAGRTLARPGAAEERPTLLLVDDEEYILVALKRLLRRDGYRILTADGGRQALELLAENEVDVIVSDQRMPMMTGVEFLRLAKDMHPQTMRIVLSGYTELESITAAVNEGAIYKFLTKPWDDRQLRDHIEEACRQKRLANDNRRLHDQVQIANAELAVANARLQELLHQSHPSPAQELAQT